MQLRQHFATELENLQEEVQRMGDHVVQMLDLSLETLSTRDHELCRRVIEMDDVADRYDYQIEQSCLRLLALQQPMSKDLRIIGTALKIITDLERIGDFAVDIAKTARRGAGETFREPIPQIRDMGGMVRSVVCEALRAYVRSDLECVHLAIEMDDQVDRCYDQIFTELLEAAEADPRIYREAVWYTHVIRFLERMADHAVNVAERVYYMVTGIPRQLAPSHGAH